MLRKSAFSSLFYTQMQPCCATLNKEFNENVILKFRNDNTKMMHSEESKSIIENLWAENIFSHPSEMTIISDPACEQRRAAERSADMSEQTQSQTQHPLYEYLSSLCREHRTGLAPIEMNAGGGKSYQMDHFIADHIKEYRFMVLCPAKKILDQSLNDLEKLGLHEGVGQDIVWIRSQEDTARKFFEEKEKNTFRLPKDFGEKQPLFDAAIKAYQDALNNLDSSEKFAGAMKDRFEEEARVHLSSTIRKLNQTIREIGFSRFSSLKTELIKNQKMPKGEAYNEVVKKILEDEDFEFLKWYCPLLYAQDAPVILMTRSKADYQISDPFYTTSFADSRIVKNRVIFVDEEDACKAMTEQTYIDNMYSNSINLLSLMQRLDMYLGERENGPDLRNFMQHSDGSPLNDEESRISGDLKNAWQRLRQEYQRMQKDWNFMTIYVPDENLLQQEDAARRFLIRSQYSYDARDSKSKPLYVYACDGKNVISASDKEGSRSGWRQLKSSRPMNPVYAGRLETFAEEMAWLVRTLLNFIRRLALFHSALEHDLNIENVEERIVKQLLQSVPAPDKKDPLQTFLLDNLYGSLYSNGAKRSGVIGDNFFDNGLHLVMLRKEEGENQPYVMQCYMCSDTPEKELCALAENTLVIAISATAEIDSDICNYDFGYARERLGENFLEMPETLKNALWDYEREHCHYLEGFDRNSSDDASIRNTVHTIDLDDPQNPFSLSDLLPDENYWKSTGKRRDPEACAALLTMVRVDLCGIPNPKMEKKKTTWTQLEPMMDGAHLKTYVIRRILTCLVIFKEYLQLVEMEKHDKSDPNRISRGVDSALCILNKIPKKQGTEDSYTDLEHLLQAMCSAYQVNPEEYPLRTLSGSEQEVETKKKTIDDDFVAGHHPFVITAYNACGYATNLQHKTLVDPSDLVKIRSDRDQNYERKDYDLLFLDEPTNVIPNIREEEMTEEERNKQVLHLEYIAGELYQAGEISVSHAHPDLLYKNIKNSGAYQKAVAKTLLQGAARIQRTGVKSYHTEYLLPALSYGAAIPAMTTQIDCKKHIVGVETEGLIHGLREIAFCETGKEPETERQNLENYEATRICRRFARSRDQILTSVHRTPTEEIRAKWDHLRRQCLHTWLTREEYEALPENERRSYFVIPEYAQGHITGYWYLCKTFSTGGDDPVLYINPDHFDEMNMLYQDERPADPDWKRMDAAYYHAQELLSLKIPEYGVDIASLLKAQGLTETMCESRAYAVLNPLAAQEYLLGVLGELCGHDLLGKICHLHPEKMEIEHLEAMDEKLTLGGSTLYIDYKNWQRANVKNEAMRGTIERKAEKLQAKTLLYLLPVSFRKPKVLGIGKPASLQMENCEVYTCEGLVYLEDGQWKVNTKLAEDIVRLANEKGQE